MTEIINNQRKLKVNFETDYRDFADALWFASDYKTAYQNNLFKFICFYAIVAGFGSIPVLMFASHYIFAVVNFALIFSSCAYFFRPASRQYLINEYKTIYGSKPFNYEIELDEDAVQLSDDLSKSIVSWQRIKSVNETEENIYLIFKHRNALKIPKAAFTNSSTTGEFFAFAISRISSTEEALNVRNNQ